MQASERDSSAYDPSLAGELRNVVETGAILELLRKRAFLTQETIATATGTTARTVRAWESGAWPRQRADDRLRDLAAIVSVLASSFTPRGISQWLLARNPALGQSRPVEILGAQPGGGPMVLRVARQLTRAEHV